MFNPLKNKRLLLILQLVCFTLTLQAQLYFPPDGHHEWDTIAPSDLEWCQSKVDSLYDFLEVNNTKAFIVLKDGKIVLEQYFNNHTHSTNWYWASAGKTLTAFLVGIAQQEGDLEITDTVSSYLGEGWTNLLPEQEEKITIRNQLTMTSGLDDEVENPFCTTDSCLSYLAEAGTRWAYHNAPYTLLDEVIESATGHALSPYIFLKVNKITGMNGLFIKQGFNNIYWSTARSMARFGLLILNRGNWNGNQVLTDTTYFDQMVTTSQNLNKSYGYLWWLNGKDGFMIPQSQVVFPGSLLPHAPSDLIAAMGANGQYINVVPSQNLVLIRMGNNPENTLVPSTFNDDIWQYMNELECMQTSREDISRIQISVKPNPFTNRLSIQASTMKEYTLYDMLGKVICKGEMKGSKVDIEVEDIPRGMYILNLTNDDVSQTVKVFRE